MRTFWRGDRVQRAADRATREYLFRGAGLIRKIARGSIRRRKNPDRSSPRGRPPHTHTGQLKRALAFMADPANNRAIIGPRRSIVGRSGRAHEFGGRFRGDRYPRRPFMGPALDSARDDLARIWRDAVRR